jgi:transcriptional regulator with XRE-family HTH domain
MTQGSSIETTASRRLRSLRQDRGWSLDDLAGRANMSASTISRLETGRRRLSVDHLVVLAAALGTTVDELLVDPDGAGPVIRPIRNDANGHETWLLSKAADPTGRVIAKMRVPPSRLQNPETRVHPGREWFYVLDGTVRLVLGDHEHLVETGSAADFDTMTPHSILGYGGPAEVLTIFDHHGERAHLRPPDAGR